MKARLFTILFMLGISKLGLSQAEGVEEVSFWQQRFIGLQMIEIIIAVIAIVGVVYVAYRMSITKKQ